MRRAYVLPSKLLKRPRCPRPRDSVPFSVWSSSSFARCSPPKEVTVIIGADALPDSTELSADLAVVGAGPAGIAIALEMAKHGFDVLLIESGYDKFNVDLQQLSDAAAWDPRLHSHMSITVRRQLGGTSVIWPGRCVPYDPVDFDRRPPITDVAWPVTYEELLPYFQRACDWLRCGRAVFSVDGMSHLPASLVPGLGDGDVSVGTLERWSQQPNFARAYGDALRQSARVRVVTGLTCTQVTSRAGDTRAD